MKRRSFLQFFGLASAAPLAVKAAAKAEEVAKALPIEPTVPVYETIRGDADDCATMTSGSWCVSVSSACDVDIVMLRHGQLRSRRK